MTTTRCRKAHFHQPLSDCYRRRRTVPVTVRTMHAWRSRPATLCTRHSGQTRFSRTIIILWCVLLDGSWKFGYCSIFVFIWQIVFNHGLIGSKHSSRNFQPNCAISFFRLHLMLHACIARFDVMGTIAFFGFWVGTKHALRDFAKLTSTYSILHMSRAS